MIQEFEAIVINSFKYGDNFIICKCYTEIYGLKSFILKNEFFKKKYLKKISFFIPLSQIFITSFYNKKNKNKLITINEIDIISFYNNLHIHPSKIALVIFLSDFLNIVLKENPNDLDLFYFLKNSFNFIDQKNKYFSDFYLLFILGLTKFLGFYPNIDNINENYFDMQNGVFVSKYFNKKSFLSKKKSFLLKKLIKIFINFNFIKSFYLKNFNKKERIILLNIILKYYKFQYDCFRIPKSFKVLLNIF